MGWTDDEPTSNEVNREELVQMILLNKDRKVRIKVELRDETGEPVSLRKIVSDLLEYVDGKFQDTENKDNTFISQIYPLLANVLSTSLAGSLDPNIAAAVLTNTLVKDSFMMTMSLSFLLLQYIKQNNLTIHSIEEPLTDEQIEAWDTKALISAIAGKAAMLGVDFKMAVAVVYKHGNITLDQVSQAFGYTVTEEELLELINGYSPSGKKNDDDSDPESN